MQLCISYLACIVSELQGACDLMHENSCRFSIVQLLSTHIYSAASDYNSRLIVCRRFSRSRVLVCLYHYQASITREHVDLIKEESLYLNPFHICQNFGVKSIQHCFPKMTVLCLCNIWSPCSVQVCWRRGWCARRVIWNFSPMRRLSGFCWLVQL